MPELPEVETTRRGIEPHICNRSIETVIVRERRLRWPIPAGLKKTLQGEIVHAVERRGKYLLLRTQSGTVIMHLGMSGSLRITPAHTPAERHDHLDIVFSHGQALRLRDPRRFGAVLWTTRAPEQHKLLKALGPEPLGEAFGENYLFTLSRGRKAAVKNFIMDSHVVVGVGNIYASESLFLAGINPNNAAGRISLQRYQRLVHAIRQVLTAAIAQGGTTLRDFVQENGQPGYFQQSLNVYGKTGAPCPRCAKPIRQITLGQRSTFYCTQCQR